MVANIVPNFAFEERCNENDFSLHLTFLSERDKIISKKILEYLLNIHGVSKNIIYDLKQNK